MNEILKISTVSLAIAAVIGLTACGGGGGGSDSTTSSPATSGNTITSGVITGFGSVFVDGVEFETANSSFSLMMAMTGWKTKTSWLSVWWSLSPGQ